MIRRLLPLLLVFSAAACDGTSGADPDENNAGVSDSSLGVDRCDLASIATAPDGTAPDAAAPRGATPDTTAAVSEDAATTGQATSPDSNVAAAPDVGAGQDAEGPVVAEEVAVEPPPTLHGQTPDSALPAPEFVALNADGATRTRPDLVGNPTVMWFFPLSGTPG